MITLVKKTNAINNKYQDPDNIDSNTGGVTLYDKLNTIDTEIAALGDPTPIFIGTSGTTLTSDAYGKTIFFNGDGATRYDITLPPITSDDNGKKITFIGDVNLIVGRIIGNTNQFINWLPYIEISNAYSITLVAYDNSGLVGLDTLWNIECYGVTPNIWEAKQSTQTIASGGSPTILALDMEVFDPYGIWNSSYANPYFVPGYYQVICQVTITAAVAASAVLLYAFRGGVQAGDAIQDTIPTGVTKTLTFVYTGYFDGLNANYLDFRVMQTTAGALSQDVIYAKVSGEFIMLGP